MLLHDFSLREKACG